MDDTQCEDGIVVTDDYIAVIDGSTSKTQRRLDPEKSNGQLCRDIIAESIANAPSGFDMPQMASYLTQAVSNYYLLHDADLRLLASQPVERLTASTVIYSRVQQEIWLIGDCQCMIDHVYHGNPKPSEARLSALRAEHDRYLLQHGRTLQQLMEHDDGREFILPKLKESCQAQNKEYAVVDGFNIPLQYVKVFKAGREIVLATDGYPQLCDTLEQSESKLSQLIDNDPLCISQFKATKGLKIHQNSFDDRAYIRFLTD